MKKQNLPNQSQHRPRTNIPATVKSQVLTEAGYMCANPRCKHILTLELHHLEWVQEGGNNDASNLVALCANCHDLHTRGHIPRSAIDAWKQMLMLVNGSLDRESLDLLLFMYKFEEKSLDMQRAHREWTRLKDEEYDQLGANPDTTQRQFKEHAEKWRSSEPQASHEQPLRLSGDGLLRLVRLIRTGLVEEGKQHCNYIDMNEFYYWEPELTTTGQQLSEAFLNGDAKTFHELLEGQHDSPEERT
jgi:HNH endonuclease